MPKRSAASLAIAPVRLPRTRLQPPRNLSKGAARVFADIVSACEPEHFNPADLPLLIEYARAVDLADRAARELDKHGAVIDGKTNPHLIAQEKAVRAMVALAARLRICPQSRFDRAAAGARARNPQGTVDFAAYFARNSNDE